VAKDKQSRAGLSAIRGAVARRRARRWSVPHPERVTGVFGEPPAPELCPRRMRVLVWNVYKGKRRSWAPRFRELSEGRDLILAQELYFEPRTHALLDESQLQWTTATSFVYPQRGGVGTGLGTAAGAASTRKHALLSSGREPLTRTPKLALLTEYRLRNQQTLLVANVHAINFAGFASFDDQLRRIETAIAQHDGPLLVAGDFNTWTTRRLRRLDALMRTAALEPVEFAGDRRPTPLDHAFVRNLRVSSGELHRTRASDHAALSFEVAALDE
jgi:endonuclease/exonuclease/phosphatase (EEP) superfamily protein YafD